MFMMMQSRFGVHFNICLYHGNEEITINCNFDDYMYTTEQAIKCVCFYVFLKEVNEHAVFSDQTV